MPKHKKPHIHKKEEKPAHKIVEMIEGGKPDSVADNITINITYNIYIGNTEIQVEQRAEGGGQILKDVGVNANQGGQNALNNSSTSNDQSNFANGNGRSGIAGNDNDEMGGQQGIKLRDSLVAGSIIGSTSEQSESPEPPDEEVVEGIN